MQFKILALICATVLFQKTYAQDSWVLIGTASNNSIWYLQSTMVKKDPTGIQVWVKELNVDFSYQGQVYNHGTIRQLMISHCGERKVMTIRTMWYDQGGGLVHDTGPIYPRQYMWRAITPDTMEELVLNKTCELFN